MSRIGYDSRIYNTSMSMDSSSRSARTMPGTAAGPRCHHAEAARAAIRPSTAMAASAGGPASRRTKR